MKIILDVIAGDKMRDKLMHSADLFEQGKILGEHNTFEVNGTKKIKINEVTTNVAKAFEEGGNLVVSFVGIRSIDGKPVKDAMVYLKPGVQSISDGHNWDIFKKLLNGLGYTKVETTEYMQVTSVNW